MLPALSQEHATYQDLANSQFLSQDTLVCNRLRANPDYLILGEFSVGVCFATRHQFRMQLRNADMPAFRRTIQHVQAIVSGKQMNGTKACGRVASVADQKFFRDIAMKQDVSKSMYSRVLSSDLNFPVSVPKEIAIPQEAWI